MNYQIALAKLAHEEGKKEKEKTVKEAYKAAYDSLPSEGQRVITEAQIDLEEIIRDRAKERGDRDLKIGDVTTLEILGAIGMHWEHLRRKDAE